MKAGIKSKREWIDKVLQNEPVWVFAYGSLLWKPGFNYEESIPATIFGYHRSFCVLSHIHRGTQKFPGLVLGLTKGGSCRGKIFRINTSTSYSPLTSIWEREMVYSVYSPRRVLAYAAKEKISCWAFITNPSSNQFVEKLNVRQMARLISIASGKAGSNIEYLENTIKQLEILGLPTNFFSKIKDKAQKLNG